MTYWPLILTASVIGTITAIAAIRWIWLVLTEEDDSINHGGSECLSCGPACIRCAPSEAPTRYDEVCRQFDEDFGESAEQERMRILKWEARGED